MPQVKDGPEGLNKTLEKVYSQCMTQGKGESYCSAVAWSAAKQAGWHKDKSGKWTKGKKKA